MAGGAAAPVRGHVPRRGGGVDGGHVGPGGGRGAVPGTRGSPRRTAPDALWLACSHGDVIKAIVADALGLHLDLFQRIVVDPASVTVIRYTPGRPFLVRLNDSAAAWPRSSRRPGVGAAGQPTRTPPSAAAPAPTGPADGRRGRRWRRLRFGAAARRAARVLAVTQVYAFEPPERFVAGTVGAPGERTFFLQARGGGRLVSVVAGEGPGHPAGREARGAARRGAPPVRRRRARGRPTDDDNEPLDLPLDEEFRVGTLGLAWDGDTDTVVIEAIAVGEYEAEEPTEEELRRPGPDAGTPHPGRDPGVHRAGQAGGLRRPPAVPAVRAAAGPGRAPLPAPQRLPPVAWLSVPASRGVARPAADDRRGPRPAGARASSGC